MESRFLILSDYRVLITEAQLAQITENQIDIDTCADQSEEEVKEYIRHRFDTDIDMRPFQIVTEDSPINASQNERIYNSTTDKKYIALEDVTGGNLTNTTQFKEADDRNQKLVQVTSDVFLYHLHSRLNPDNIPTHRRLRYDGDGDTEKAMSAVRWLMQVQKGTITPDLTVFVDEEGDPLRSGESISYGTVRKDGERGRRYYNRNQYFTGEDVTP